MPIAKLSEEEIIKIQNLCDQGLNPEEIANKTGHNILTVKKYGEQPRLVPREQQPQNPPVAQPVQPQGQPPVPVMPSQQPQQARVVQPQQVRLQPAQEPQPRTILPSHPSTIEPHEWLKNFLGRYSPPLKTGFAQLLSDRAKIRKQLPTAAQLVDDIVTGDSNIKSTAHAASIAEIYEFELRDYLEQRRRIEDYYKTPYRGVPIHEPSTRPGYSGVQVDQFSNPYYDRYDPRYQRQPQRAGDGYTYPYDTRQGIPVQPAPTYYYQSQPPHQVLESELERFARLQSLFAKTEEKSPLMTRLEQENQQLMNRLNQLETDSKQALTSENLSLKNQVQQLGERRRDLENKIRSLEVAQSQKAISETDVEMQKIGYDHELNLRKIEDKNKDRELYTDIGQGIMQTIGDVAMAWRNMSTGETGELQTTVGEETIRTNCPSCKSPLTFPKNRIGQAINCPNCGMLLEIGGSEPTRTPRYVPPVKEPPSSQASFTVETPPESETEESMQGICPHCNKPMLIPKGASRVECPSCGKPLEVSGLQETPSGEVAPPIEREPERYSGVPSGEIVEKKEIKETMTTPAMPKEKPPDWKSQRKMTSEPPPIESPSEELISSVETTVEEKIEEPTPILEQPPVPEKPPVEQPPISEPYIKDGYTLFKAVSKSGRPWYFFGKKSTKGTPVSEIPEGYMVGKNKRTGLPYLKRRREDDVS